MSRTLGFTLVELMVTVAIFVFMTALIVARYGAFNQGTLLTNTAYDMAMTIRLAQTYGTSVTQVSSGNVNGPTSNSFSNQFSSGYGIEVSTLAGNGKKSPTFADPKNFTLFQDADQNGVYNTIGGDQILKSYQFKGGATITSIIYCSGTGCTNKNNMDVADVTFKRPNPEAIIYTESSGVSNNFQLQTGGYLVITITSADGTASRNVVIQNNGEVSVQ